MNSRRAKGAFGRVAGYGVYRRFGVIAEIKFGEQQIGIDKFERSL